MTEQAVNRKTVRLRAHAKLNLGLAVLGRRDDGFHEIDTLFARLGLFDELWLERAEDVSGVLEPGETPAALHGLRMDSDNLVLRAAQAYLQAAGKPGGVQVRLRKHVPVAAGLGGGSSDAAAVLRGLAHLYPAAVELAPIAGELGSDVPFFLANHGAARAGGRGEQLEPLELPRLAVVLANPGLAVGAAEAYGLIAAFDPPLAVADIAARLGSGRAPGYVNTLQEGVARAYPPVAETLTDLRELGLHGVLMSGSGPTCFGLAADIVQAQAVARELAERRPFWWVWSGEAC